MMKRRHYDLCARQFRLRLGVDTKIMAIINCTPDSFSQDGRFLRQGDVKPLLTYALGLIKQGADILDIGGESTRPGASVVSVKEELRRVIPLIERLASTKQVMISIDTTKPQVARQALAAGACMVNTVYGTRPAKGLLKAVKDYDAAIVLMHSRGTSRTMQRQANYKDLMGEIIQELAVTIENCLEIGIKKDRIILDPGIGFAKGALDNLRIINQLPLLGKMGFPVLLGPSRKSFIGHVLNVPVQGRLMGTAAAVSAGIMQGAHVVRVHDVKQMKEVASLTDAIINAHA